VIGNAVKVMRIATGEEIGGNRSHEIRGGRTRAGAESAGSVNVAARRKEIVQRAASRRWKKD
jgi:hypothetical protein